MVAVADALERLGFDVENMDDQHEPGSRHEVLQVRSPDAPEWVALVEVKGYKRGAKANDLMSLIKYHGIYKDKLGPPSALWYMANHFLDRSPDEHPLVLAANDDEVASFASDWNGLVIDTCDLFSLLNLVEAGDIEPTEARKLFTQKRRRFELLHMEAPEWRNPQGPETAYRQEQ